MKRIRLASAYAFASRLEEYRRILTAALNSNYRVCSVEQSLDELRAGTERLFVLRHDVDHISPGVRAMSDIEAHLGVSSTYYFRLCTLDQADVAHVKAHNHEISFHYETIADYALENGISDRATLESGEHLANCTSRLASDLERFRRTVNAPCRTLASHGAPLNRTLGLPNRILFERCPALAQRLGVLEAYNPSYLGQFDCYISDTQWEINDGFRYGINPLQAISDQTPRIMMLTHPNHWAFTWRTRMRRIVKSLLRGEHSDPAPFAEAERLRYR